jgi:hypothetical protein
LTEYKYRWVRTHLCGHPDPRSAASAVKAGWELVPFDERPVSAEPPKDPGWGPPDLLDPSVTVEYGGLRLYRMPAELTQARADYLQARVKANTEGPAESFLRDNDAPGMRKFFLKRQETTYHATGPYLGGEDRPNRPTPKAKKFYSTANCAEFPERAEELKAYRANLKINGLKFPRLLQAVWLN